MIVKLKVTSVAGFSGSVGFCPACLTYPPPPQQLQKVVAPNQRLHRKPGEFTTVLQNIWIRTTTASAVTGISRLTEQVPVKGTIRGSDDIVLRLQPRDWPSARGVDMDQRRAASTCGLTKTEPGQRNQGEVLVPASTDRTGFMHVLTSSPVFLFPQHVWSQQEAVGR